MGEFGALPPEVNTGRLISGAGAAPMIASSATFTGYSVAIEVFRDQLIGTLGRLAASWNAPTHDLLTLNAAKKLTWLALLQAQTTTAAARTMAQANLHTAAVAATPPLPELAQNHVTHGTLVATNFLGVNTVPIGVNEADYGRMWAQAAANMAAYLAASTANTTFEPFVMAPGVAMPVADVGPTGTQIPAAAAAGVQAVATAAISVQNAISALSRTAATGPLLGAAQAESEVNRARTQAQNQSEASEARSRGQMEQHQGREQQAAREQMMQQGATQMITQGAQAPQQAAQQVQQIIQQPQQIAQQVASQVASQVGSQAASNIDHLMAGVPAENRLPGQVGLFGTQAGSPTLAGFAIPPMSLVQVGSLSGLSGGASGLRMPTSWAPITPPTAAAGAPSGGGAAPARQVAQQKPRRGRVRNKTVVADVAAPASTVVEAPAMTVSEFLKGSEKGDKAAV